MEFWPEGAASASISARRASMVKWAASGMEPAVPFSEEGARSRELEASTELSAFFSLSESDVEGEWIGASDSGITTPGKFWRSFLKGLNVRKPIMTMGL